jgi:hypothetical protein
MGAYIGGNDALFTNSGVVTGGVGGISRGAGGAGVFFAASNATFRNSGTVTGGAGAGFGGAGGAAASFVGTGATFANSGTVTGGTGGNGGASRVIGGGAPGVGGVGASFAGAGATFANSGAVTGGVGGGGGSAGGAAGIGGVGVTGADLTIINSGTISGGLSGDGITRANAITFKGGANILEVRAGSTIIGNVAGTGFDTLRLGGSANGSFDVSGIGTQYQGFSSLQKVGDSAFTLTGVTNALTPWSIDQGALIVDGSIARSSLTSVNDGGTLSGVGTVGDLQVNDGGVFAPGTAGAPGTMTVAGNLTFASGSSYNVVVTGPSPVDVTGTASLAGTLNATFGSGTYLRKTYDILHAEGGLGNTKFTRANVFGLLPNFRETLSYTSTDVLLGLTAELGAGSVLAGNPRRVADALDTYFNNGGVLPPKFVDLFGLTGSNLSNALGSVSGEAATGVQQVAFQSMRQFLDLMLDPTVVGRNERAGAYAPALAFAPERAPLPQDIARAYASVLKSPAPIAPAASERLWTSWASSFGGHNRIGGDLAGAGTHDLSARVAGVAAGFDYSVSHETILGFALAGGGTNLGPVAGNWHRQEPFFPNRRLCLDTLGASLSLGFVRLRQSLGLDRALGIRRLSRGKFRRPELRRPGRRWLSAGGDGRLRTLCRRAGARFPHARLQRDRAEWGLRPELQWADGLRYPN